MTKKLETLKGYLQWLSPDKFLWSSPCRCWDALLLSFATKQKSKGGCLYNTESENENRESHKPLYDLGFTFEELRDFELLIRFWNGEKGYIDHSFNDQYTHNYDVCYRTYENGIEYLKEWISHLESQQKPKTEYVVTKVYKPVNVDAELLEGTLNLN